MRDELLTIDGAVNLILGVLLIVFPAGIVNALGVPGSEGAFYANILGGVLFGIGLALIIERFRHSSLVTGLGLMGAVCINLCGGLVLVLWLLMGNLYLSQLGNTILWVLAAILVILSALELYHQLKVRGNRAETVND